MTSANRTSLFLNPTWSMILLLPVFVAGCGMGFPLSNVGFLGGALPPGLTGQIAAKAIDVAHQIGGEDGFGGTLLDGYEFHMMPHMGFHDPADLADSDGDLAVVLSNQSDEDCTFHVTYVASHLGLDDQLLDVNVPAGDETTIMVPCSEIIGLGLLEVPGSPGCHLADGQDIDNAMVVPGFLGTDYDCNMVYHFYLQPDSDDLDGDGNTEELILVSDALGNHKTNAGPFDHAPGFGCMMCW